MNPILRRATPEDASPAGTICYRAFKAISEAHGFPADFPDAETAIGLIRELLSRTDVHPVIAESDGRVIGSNFLWEDGPVAGIGPITVEPDMQNVRVGRKLMEAVLERARVRGIPSVRLVQAAYHGRSLSLYTRLGFEAREPLSVMQGAALDLTIDGCVVRRAIAADLEPANELCRRIHGHARSGELGLAIERTMAIVVERAKRLTGYTTGIGFFGHTVGETVEDVKALIGAAPDFPGPGFLLPTRNAELLRWCLHHRLRIVQPMTLMTIGRYSEPKGSFLPSILY